MKKILLFFLLNIYTLFIYAQGQNALDFDGIDDEVTAPAASSLIAGANQLSITCWVYPTNANPMYPDFDGFAGFRNELDCDFYVMQVSPSTAIEARFRNSTGTYFTITYQGLSLNTWQHLALTFDGSMLRLYVNGLVADSVAANGAILNTAEDFHIGTLPYSTNWYWLTGQVDEISLFNRALSPAEISCISQESVDPSDPNCILFYTCNQGTANGVNTSISALEDASGHIDGVFNAMALAGPTSNFVGGVNNAASVSQSICQGDSYLFGTDVLTQAGTYYMSTPQNGGCGTLHELILAVTAVDTSVSVAGETLTANAAGAVYQWLDCNNGNTPINGANAQSFTPAGDGSYALAINQNGCSDTSACYTITGVGINENAINNLLAVHPNPAKDQFEVTLKNATEGSWKIFNATGEVVLTGSITGTTAHIDATTLSAGIYFIELSGNFPVVHSRIVKN